MLGKVIHRIQRVIHSQDLQLNANWETAIGQMTEVEVLTEMKEQLVKVCHSKSGDFNSKMQLVLDIDEKTHRKVRELTRNYLKLMNKNSDVKKDIEMAVYAFLRQLYLTYTHIIVEYKQQSSILLNTKRINLLLARYLNAAFMMAKWRYFDDQPAPVGLWSNIHQVIKIAEELTIINKSLFLYDFQHKETSLATLLMRGFMLNTLQKGSYTPFQIELTDRVLKAWSTNLTISNQYNTQNEYQFFIHLDGDKSPQRLRSAKQHPDFRYWNTSRMVGLMESYLCAVNTGKSLESFNLLTMAKTEDLVDLFQKLRVDWCVTGYKRQRRTEEREVKYKRLNVSHGLDQISARINYLQHKSTVAKSLPEPVSLALVMDAPLSHGYYTDQQPNAYDRENWTMLEESQHGFSIEMGKEISDWVKSGTLIGYSTIDNNNKIALAEIKTVRKRADGTYRVGLAKLTSNAIVLAINKVEKSTPFVADANCIDDENLALSETFHVLFFDDDMIEKPRLIMPRYQYKRASRYRVDMNGEIHMVLAGEVVNSHRDWVCFDIVV